jgi:hypothetical protein
MLIKTKRTGGVVACWYGDPRLLVVDYWQCGGTQHVGWLRNAHPCATRKMWTVDPTELLYASGMSFAGPVF